MRALKQAQQRQADWMNASVLRPADRAQIQALDDPALIDAFGKTLDFGTGGVRAELGMGTAYINRYTIAQLTQGLAMYLQTHTQTHIQTHTQASSASTPSTQPPSVCVAYDSRYQSAELAQVTAQVLIGNAVSVYLFDALRPTPLLSFAVRHLGCTMGVVITASHNPKQYNGYKVYNAQGAQLVAPEDAQLMRCVAQIKHLSMVRWGDAAKAMRLDDAIDAAYVQAITQWLTKHGIGSPNTPADPIRVVYTPLHGAGAVLMPQLLRQGGATVHVVPEQATPCGDFPTVTAPNPEEPSAWVLAFAAAQKHQAHIAMVTDADADRLGIAVPDATGTWQLLSGNQLGALLFDFVLSKIQPHSDAHPAFVAKTIVSSQLMNAIAQHHGMPCYQTLTGFKYIAELIHTHKEERFVCGAEESYGYLIGDVVRDKDALVSAMTVLAMIKATQPQSLWDRLLNLYRQYGLYYEELHTLTLEGTEGKRQIDQCMERNRAHPPEQLDGLPVVVTDYIQPNTGITHSANVLHFATDDADLYMRPSGTEPKLKIYLSLHKPWDQAPYAEQCAALGARAKYYYAALLDNLY